MVAGQSCIAGPAVGFPACHTRLLGSTASIPAKRKRPLARPPDGQNASAGASLHAQRAVRGQDRRRRGTSYSTCLWQGEQGFFAV